MTTETNSLLARSCKVSSCTNTNSSSLGEPQRATLPLSQNHVCCVAHLPNAFPFALLQVGQEVIKRAVPLVFPVAVQQGKTSFTA
jgi:hypothetical protein